MPPPITSPGDLRVRISFERRGLADDGFGNTVTGDWEAFYQCQARVMPLRGSEDVQAQRLSGTQPVAITVRDCPESRAIKVDDRAVDFDDATKIYNIRAIANFDEHRKYLEILAIAGVAV